MATYGYTDMYTRWNAYDEYLYDKLLGEGQFGFIRKSKAFMEGTSNLPQAMGRGLVKGTMSGAKHLLDTTGIGYMGAGVTHYAKNTPGSWARSVATRGTEWNKYFTNIHPTLDPLHPKAMLRAGAGRTKSALGVLGRGLMPGLAIYGATEDEMGFGIGLGKQIAGWTGWGFGSSMGMQMGGWAGGGAVRAASSGLSKIPGVKKLAVTAMARTSGKIAGGVGALIGGPIGWLVGGLAAFETASWAVGMALHTLPTFAKQFKSDMAMSGYGGDYTDSAGAITMRQRSLQVMGKSFVNARSALGQEGALLHA